MMATLAVIFAVMLIERDNRSHLRPKMADIVCVKLASASRCFQKAQESSSHPQLCNFLLMKSA